jgi:hypothetical protein
LTESTKSYNHFQLGVEKFAILCCEGVKTVTAKYKYIKYSQMSL